MSVASGVLHSKPPGSEPAIAAEVRAAVSALDIHKWYGDLHVLRGVTLEVARGEVIVICGPSGSGKSTLLRCLNGLEPFAKGTLQIAGHNLPVGPAGLQALRCDVGMVFQQFNLFSHLRAIANITLALRRVKRLSRKDAEQQAMALLERVGVADKARRYPEQLSGGEQQRVAIARALAMRPDVMLFDEPTSALDPEMTKEVVDVLRDLVSEGMTMLVATHEMGFAREAANRVLFMDEGQFVEDLPTAEFFANPRAERTREFLAKIMRH